MENDFVFCPVCKGSKISKVTNQACKLCNETGRITLIHSLILAEIRRDLTAKLLQEEASAKLRDGE